MSRNSSPLLPASRELYPVVHDLTEAEYSDPTLIGSSVCCGSEMMGCFSVFDLVRPLQSPRCLSLTSSSKKTSKPTHRPTKATPHMSSESNDPSLSFSSYPTIYSSEVDPMAFGSSNTILTAATSSSLDTCVAFDDEYVLTRQISRRKISTVWECIHKEQGTRHCVKIIDKRRFAHGGDEEASRNEIHVLSALQTHHSLRLVRMIQLIEERHKTFIIMGYIEGGNLVRFTRDELLSEAEIRTIARSILLGLQELHEMGIAHMNLQPSNVMLEANHQDTVLCDFGFATDTWRSARAYSVRNGHKKGKRPYGCLSYAAPELCTMEFKPGLSADLWSLGIILHQLFVHELPFEGSSKQRVREEILHAQFDFNGPMWVEISRPAKQFISSLLHRDPYLRMTVKEALSHPWILCPPPSALWSSDEGKDTEALASSDFRPDISTSSALPPMPSRCFSRTIKSKLRFAVRGAKRVISRSLRLRCLFKRRENRTQA